jgi:choline kinase/thiamine kinase-like enzyme
LSDGPIVCILTAGKGTRMGALGLKLNKALHPIGAKAIISRIIEKFPADAEFVIGLGYLGKQVRDYLQIAHGDRKITYADVDNFDGPGSGPGYSLLCCKDHLQKPFYFVSCDTLWDNDVDWTMAGNWFGVSPVEPGSSAAYCNLKVIEGRVVDLRDKQIVPPTYQAFVGLCRIEDHATFWSALQSTDQVAGEHQISNGVKALITDCVTHAQQIDWTDVGDAAKYKAAVARYEDYDFSKQDEALYIVNRKVIKFFTDEAITRRRVEKAGMNPRVFPKITHHRAQFYAYDYQPGETLYASCTPDVFAAFLNWLRENLWQRKSVAAELMRDTCMKFYRDKTLERVTMFQRKYALRDVENVINGRRVPPTAELLQSVPWARLADGTACFMHGDLQFDNVLCDRAARSFVLLDWRQDFGGHMEFGDLYYDLAKLYGGIILNYDYIKLHLLRYEEDGDRVFYDFAMRFQTPQYLQQFTEYLEGNGFDISKVKILVGLIYLNMSPLHHFPFDKMLYSLGREFLYREVGNPDVRTMGRP